MDDLFYSIAGRRTFRGRKSRGTNTESEGQRVKKKKKNAFRKRDRSAATYATATKTYTGRAWRARNTNPDVPDGMNLRVPPDRPHSIPVRITLANSGRVLVTDFAVYDTISDVQRYVLPALWPSAVYARQVRVSVWDGRRQTDVTDGQTALRQYWTGSDPVRLVADTDGGPAPYGHWRRRRCCSPSTGGRYRNANTQTVRGTAECRPKKTKCTQVVYTRDACVDTVRDYGTQTEPMCGHDRSSSYAKISNCNQRRPRFA